MNRREGNRTNQTQSSTGILPVLSEAYA